MNGAAEHLDADATTTGFAGFLTELGAAVDAGKEFVERDARRNFGTRAAADVETGLVGGTFAAGVDTGVSMVVAPASLSPPLGNKLFGRR